MDAGHGWLIFAVPAAEVAFHPHDQNNKHEMFFTCDELKVQVAALQKKSVQVGKISEEKWGLAQQYRFLAGVPSDVYEPKHPVAFEKNFAKEKTRQTNRPKEATEPDKVVTLRRRTVREYVWSGEVDG